MNWFWTEHLESLYLTSLYIRFSSDLKVLKIGPEETWGNWTTPLPRGDSTYDCPFVFARFFPPGQHYICFLHKDLIISTRYLRRIVHSMFLYNQGQIQWMSPESSV